MYYPLLTSSFFLVLFIIAYRQRRFFTSFLPESFHARLPEILQPESGPSLSHSHTTSSSVPWSRRFLPNSWVGATGYHSIPGFDWAANIRNGLNSSLFDIEANVASGDARSGLDPRGAQDIQTIMARYNVSFDEARLIRHKQALASNNIDPVTGLPLDSKAVTSLGGRIPSSSNRH